MAVALEAELGYPVDLECAWREGQIYLPAVPADHDARSGATPIPPPLLPGLRTDLLDREATPEGRGRRDAPAGALEAPLAFPAARHAACTPTSSSAAIWRSARPSGRIFTWRSSAPWRRPRDFGEFVVVDVSCIGATDQITRQRGSVPS